MFQFHVNNNYINRFFINFGFISPHPVNGINPVSLSVTFRILVLCWNLVSFHIPVSLRSPVWVRFPASWFLVVFERFPFYSNLVHLFRCESQLLQYFIKSREFQFDVESSFLFSPRLILNSSFISIPGFFGISISYRIAILFEILVWCRIQSIL